MAFISRTRLPKSGSLAVTLVSLVAMSLVAVVPAGPAAAAPVVLTKSMPEQILLGADIDVSLTLTNPSGPDGFNASFNDTLPPGVSYVPGSAAPDPDPQVLTQGDGSTVLVWRNLADSLTGTTVTVDYAIATDGTFDVGDIVTNSANAYVNDDARVVPRFDAATGEVVPGTFSREAAAGDQTELIPFEITKSEPNAEAELLRGLHDHQTIFTLRVDNNLVNPSTGFSVVDFLPAELEFLGCGTEDNTTTGEEYPGAGVINPGNAPTLSAPPTRCPTPSSVTTVTTDPDGGGPLADDVYTRVEYDAASLAAAFGSADLAASGFLEIEYVVAIPLRENVQATLANPTANLDNNTGALTTETASSSFPESEATATNYAVAAGTYGATGYTDDDISVVSIEDVTIHKTVSDETFEQGDTPTFTLFVESSEYATATGSITVTDTLPAGLNLTSATPAPSSGPVTNPDGTQTYTWTRPAFTAPNSTDTITIETVVREFYRDGAGGDSADPVSSRQSFTNVTDLSTTATIITDNDASTSSVPVVDESAATLSSGGPSILKQVSDPVVGTLTCGDGSAGSPTYSDDTASGAYRPGDRVCFKLNVFFPANLDTLDPIVQDLLPPGYEFESFQYGADNNIPTGDITADATPGDTLVSWQLPGDVDAGARFQVVISSLIVDPDAATDADILANLQKFRYGNGSGEVFQLRDQADAPWAEPLVTLAKGVLDVDDVTVPGAPADGVQVDEADVVTYGIDVSNSGSIDANDVSVRDVLPAGITCADVSAISDSGTCTDNSPAQDWIQWDSSLVAPATGSFRLTYDVTIPVGTTADETFTNTAGVRQFTTPTNTGTPFTYVPADNIDPTLTPNTSAASDTSSVITATPTIAKSATSPISAGNSASQATIGETISYTVVVTLPAGLTYTDAVITDTIDAEKELDEGSVTADLDGTALPTNGLTLSTTANSFTVNFPTTYTAPSGADQVITITFDADVADVGANARNPVGNSVTSNTATFTFDDAGGTPQNVSDSVNTTIVEPNITLTKTNDDTATDDGVVEAGQLVNYTLAPRNAGTRVSTAYETTIVDTVPEDLIVQTTPGSGVAVTDGGTVGPNGGTWNAAARTITWDLGDVAPGATPSLTYQVQVDNPLLAAGELTNTAAATTSSLDGATAGERTTGTGYSASAQSTVTVPVLSIAKDASPTSATVGETVGYTLDVTVPGGVVASDVTVIDQIPAGIRFESLTDITCAPACSPAITSASAVVIPATGPYASGDDIAFFFDEAFATEGTADRVVTITYDGFVADVVAADAGSTLTNTAAVYWNATDDITATPTAVPATSSFDESSAPDTADVATLEPTLTIDKNVNGEGAIDDQRRARPGDVLTYTLSVTNADTDDTGPAYDVVVTDIATDPTWVFGFTPVAGVTLVDGDPAGSGSDAGLEWSIPGPIARNETVTITYTLTVPADFDETDEIDPGFEQVNIADVPSYYAVPVATRTDPANAGRSYREYDDVVADTVSVELDLASIGDFVWFDVDGDGVQDPGEPGIADTTVTVTYLGPDGVLDPPGDPTPDDEVFTTTTDANGLYLVEDLPGGTYLVDVDEADPDFLGGLTPSYDLDGTTATPNGAWTGTLAEDAAERDVDFGYTGVGSIGDTIWFDQNENGVKDAGEAGFANIDVTVTWFGPDGVAGGTDDIVYTATTDSSGVYLVDDLPTGAFSVAVDTADLPAGLSNVSDPDATLDSTSLVTLTTLAPDDLDQDFGYSGDGSIGDTIYLDRNGDGDQDGDEPGLEGVSVQLIGFGPDGVEGGDDDSTFTTVTGTDGAYLFDNLPPGDYRVTVTGGLPANVTNTDDPDDATGGDSTSVTTLTAVAPDDLDQDFGYDADSVLGDRVWWDRNADGVQDAGEPGINGVTVRASGPSGIVLTTVTSGDGDYLFSDIADGDWTIEVVSGVPAGFTQTYDASGSSTDATSTTTLLTSDLLQDFGYAGDSSIGDFVWLDLDGDGVQDSTEPGIEDVDVELTWFGPDGALDTAPGGDDVVLVTQTDGSGGYLFEGLPAGEFSVRVVESDPDFPAGVSATFDRDGTTVTPDGVTPVTLGASEDVDDVDFGYVGGGSIGDTVWFDRNANGVLDGDEVGLAGVGITLLYAGEDGDFDTAGDNETFTTTTDADGTYLFIGLPPGAFRVSVATSDLPVGMTPTFDADGGADSVSELVLGDGEANLDQDFGYAGAGSIGDVVYLDLDGDGTQDPGEPGVPGQTVTLTWPGPGGSETFTTVTDADGRYLFDGLPPATYDVTIVGGVVDAADNTGDPDGGGDSTSSVVLGDGETNLDQDFGFGGNNSIGDTVWYDVDGDGVDDAGEPRLADVGVVVRWFGPDGVLGGDDDISLPTTTDTAGTYLAAGLPDGTYRVTVAGGLPAGLDVATFDADSGTTTPDATSLVTDLGVGTTDPVDDLDQDFGFTGSGSIGDTIWLDLDGDGTFDTDEPGIPAVTVALVSAGPDGDFGTLDDVVFATQSTDGDGRYLFENLPADDYRVTVSDLPAGMSNTFDPDGGGDDTSLVTLAAGVDDLGQDFGYNGSASVGDTVFLDVDGNGTQDPGEPGLPGVSVTVASPGVDGIAGTADDIVVTVVTDDDGVYGVDGLPPGPTIVSYDPSDLGADLAPDSDRDGDDPTTTTLTLANGDDVVDVDFGVVGDATIDGTVFIDTNTDGVQDPDESGIGGVTVEVTWAGPNGPVTITVVTDPDGNWSLTDIPSGDYTVTVVEDTLPDGLVPTTLNDVDVTVPPGGSNTVDNGFVPGGSIGDRVWSDVDADGRQDAGEPGVSGVTVRLLDPSGAVITTTITDADGDYVFDDLPPGDYVVEIDPTTIPANTTVGFDRDGNRDGSTNVPLAVGQTVVDVDFGIVSTTTTTTTTTATPAGGGLPRTGGGGVGTVLWIGFALLGIGMMLLVVRRRGRPRLT